MTQSPSFYRIDPDGLRLSLKILPRARVNKFLSVSDGFLRVSLKAPPVDCKANKALTRFLADTLQVKMRDITLVKGNRNREKVVKIALRDPAMGVRILQDSL